MATGCRVCGGPVKPRRRYCGEAHRRLRAGANISAGKRKTEPHVGTTGYRMVFVPTDHVSREGSRRKRNNRAPEHVLVAETVLGRPLKKFECVHHINGDKLDNRRSNLLICTRSYHNALHSRMSALYQREKFGVAA